MRASTVISIFLVLLCIALNAFLRLPVLDNIFCDPDVAGCAYSAQELMNGGAMYDTTVETKPPGSYLLFATVFSLFGKDMVNIYIASIFHFALVILGLFILGRMLLSNGTGVLAAFTYAVYSVSSAANGHCPNFETWTIAPITWMFVFLWLSFDKRRSYWMYAAGFMAGTALLFKQTVLMVPAAALWLVWSRSAGLENRAARAKRFVQDVAPALWGGVIPLVLVALFFMLRGGLSDLIGALNPANYVGYISTGSWTDLWDNKRFIVLLFWDNTNYLIFFCAAIFNVSLIKSKQNTDEQTQGQTRLILVWLFGAIASVVAGSKFFDHYFVLIIPPLCLAAAYYVTYVGFFAGWKKTYGIVLTVVFVLLSITQMRLEFRMAYQGYQDQVTLGRFDWGPANRFFWERSNLPNYSSWSHRQMEVGQCIGQKLQPDQKILVWDYAPGIYWYAGSRAPSRHFMYFQLAPELPLDAGSWDNDIGPGIEKIRNAYMTDLRKDPPEYIIKYIEIDNKNEHWTIRGEPVAMFDQLKSYTMGGYQIDNECSNTEILAYRRGWADENPAE